MNDVIDMVTRLPAGYTLSLNLVCGVVMKDMSTHIYIYHYNHCTRELIDSAIIIAYYYYTS